MPAAIVPAIIGAAGAVGGAAITAHAAGSAANKQQQATNQALGVQQQIYNQTRSDLSPFAQLGAAATGNLRGLTNLGPAPAPMQAPIGQNPFGMAPRPTSARPPGLGLSGSVQMRAPNGQVSAVPADQVSHYQQLGAQVVQ